MNTSQVVQDQGGINGASRFVIGERMTIPEIGWQVGVLLVSPEMARLWLSKMKLTGKSSR